MKLIVLDFDRGDCFVYTNFDERIAECLAIRDFSAEDYIAHLGHIVENCQWMFGDVEVHENKTPADVDSGQYTQ